MAALAQNNLVAAVWRKLHGNVGIRFTRFAGAAAAAFTATEIAMTLCNGVFHLTSTPAALIAWFSGAVVSYVLSRWAWERKGKPDVLRETIPFWVISAMVVTILWLATKFGYHSAGWMHLHGVKHVLWVDFVWFVANLITFALRFVMFHYVLFADRTTAARAAATGPDAVPPGTRTPPAPAAAPAASAAASIVPVPVPVTAPASVPPAAAAPGSNAAGGTGASGKGAGGKAAGGRPAKPSGAPRRKR